MAPLWRCWDLTAKLRWSEVIFFPPRILRNTKIGHSSSRIGWDPRDLDGFLGLGKFHFFPPKKKNAPAFFFGNTKKLHGVVWKNCWVFLFSRICFFVQCGFFTTLCGWVKERSSNFGGDPFVCPPKKTNMTMEQPTWQWNMTIFNRGYIGSFMVWFSSQSCRYSFRGGGTCCFTSDVTADEVLHSRRKRLSNDDNDHSSRFWLCTSDRVEAFFFRQKYRIPGYLAMEIRPASLLTWKIGEQKWSPQKEKPWNMFPSIKISQIKLAGSSFQGVFFFMEPARFLLRKQGSPIGYMVGLKQRRISVAIVWNASWLQFIFWTQALYK